MAFSRPTLLELVTRIKSDFVSRLELQGAVLRRSMVEIVSRVEAGAAHMLHGHLEYLSKQLFGDQSDDPYLVRQAGLFGVSKNAPSYAQVSVTLTGTNGSIIPATSTVLTRSDGVQYTVDAEVTIASGTAVADVTAVLAGANGSLTAGVQLSFQSPISGVDSTATVLAVLQDGADLEGTESLRSRFLARLADPPEGGTVADYIGWALSVAGVTRAWVTPLELGPGTVVVRFARDNDPSPIPDSGEVATVQAYLDTVAPAHAAVTAFAPVDYGIDFELSITPNTSVTRAAVIAELNDVIIRTGRPGGTQLRSAFTTAIGNTTGITDYNLVEPAGDTSLSTNQLPSFGSIIWD